MLFTKYNSDKKVNVNIRRYLIDWNKSPSKEQKILQDFLYPYWKHQIILSEFRIPSTLYRVDLLNISCRICLEYSPDSTHDFNSFFHANRNAFLQRVKADLNKIKYLEKEGFTVFEVKKEDLPYLSRKFFLDKFGISL